MTPEQRVRHNHLRRHNRRLHAGLVRYARDVLGDAPEATRLASFTPAQARAWAAARGILTTTIPSR